MPVVIARNWFLVTLAAIASSGCSGVLESSKPPREVYLLQPPAVSSQSTTGASRVNLVLSVSAVPGLDSDRILVLGPDARLNPVVNAHWADHMPEVITSITRRFLSATGRFATVQQGALARPGDWLLQLELQAFFGVQDSTAEVTSVLLQWEGLLQCNDHRHGLRWQEKITVRGSSLSSLVAAHQRALDTALQQLPASIEQACPGGTAHAG